MTFQFSKEMDGAGENGLDPLAEASAGVKPVFSAHGVVQRLPPTWGQGSMANFVGWVKVDAAKTTLIITEETQGEGDFSLASVAFCFY